MGRMTTPHLGDLETVPALERPDLLAEPVAAALRGWEHADRIGVVEIDPALADTAALNEAYGLPPQSSANCVVVGGARAGEERVAAVNGLVRRHLDARKASFAPVDAVTAATAMEYGGITPVGLPGGWRLLVDSRVLGIETAVIGSGVRRSKLLLPGALTARLPGAEVVDGLAG
jgi:prolyl-tRNA editing enzyme YbaK/EbsC (Cys-tRNA(Pro) deacylase)